MALAVHIAPLAATVYWYGEPDGHARFARPIATASLQYIDLGVAVISDLRGDKMTRAMWRQLYETLVACGITELQCVRHGRRKIYHRRGEE